MQAMLEQNNIIFCQLMKIFIPFNDSELGKKLSFASFNIVMHCEQRDGWEVSTAEMQARRLKVKKR